MNDTALNYVPGFLGQIAISAARYHQAGLPLSVKEVCHIAGRELENGGVDFDIVDQLVDLSYIDMESYCRWMRVSSSGRMARRIPRFVDKSINLAVHDRLQRSFHILEKKKNNRIQAACGWLGNGVSEKKLARNFRGAIPLAGTMGNIARMSDYGHQCFTDWRWDALGTLDKWEVYICGMCRPVIVLRDKAKG